MSPERPSLAVVGAGVAGLTAAWLLQKKYRVTLFEKNDYIGGHTRTLVVPDGPDAGTPVDTGFIVMNHRNYPLFTRLLEEWEVALEDSDMSFSYHDTQSGYEYAGTGPRGIFPSAGHVFSPAHWKLLSELRRFGIVGEKALENGSAARQSLGEFLHRHHFSDLFRDRYLFAMGAAIWSSPPAALADFPAEPYLHFFQNHGLLTLRDRPTWRVVSGGSSSYVRRVLERIDATVHANLAPACITREQERVRLRFMENGDQWFDHVVIAAHADEALALLGDPDEHESKQLGAWTYQDNEVVLHHWEGVMPRRRSCWASWNFAREAAFRVDAPVSVSYWMNRLQNLATERQYFVTLNRAGELPEETVLNRTVLHHPQYTRAAMDSQAPLRQHNGRRKTWFAGSYFGFGFHEDAVRSGVEVARQLGVDW
jgi:predicted NAD/FAD-binding protein